jgi:hypothetical protein
VPSTPVPSPLALALDLDLDEAWEVEESGERPTVLPPFDLAAFARASEGHLRAVASLPRIEPITAPVEDAAPADPDGPEITGSTLEDPVKEMRDRFAMGDHAGSLALAELILLSDPGNPDAAECGEGCRKALETALIGRLGSLLRVPVLAIPRTQLLAHALDHRAGFLLSLVDGSSTLEMILDVCSMPHPDALRLVDELVRTGILALR